jgi:pimeloyl-ACP methyl ester carboxylesterase
MSKSNFLATARPVAAASLLTLLSASVQAIEWGACPDGQIYEGTFGIWDCAFLEFPLDRNDAAKGNVTSFVRRGYMNSPTEVSSWGIAGGPGSSNKPYVPMFDYLIMLNPTMTAYLVDARGTGLSEPLAACSVLPSYLDPFNATVMDAQDKCNKEILAIEGSRLAYFTTYDAAMDLQGVIEAVNPDTIGIMGNSYGSFLANTLLNLPGFEADVVLIDGPVSANRWPLENFGFMNSMVSKDSISMCVEESEICRTYLGEMGHLPFMTKDAVADGSLPCLDKLPWLAAESGNFWAGMLNSQMSPRANKAMLGPFWYRLFRCTDEDAEQLNNFYNHVMSGYYAGWGKSDPENSIAFGTNAGVADLVSLGGDKYLTYDDVVTFNRKLFAGDESFFPFARDVSGWPFGAPNPLSVTFARPTCPVHILVGTLDHNTNVGQAYWMKDRYGPSVDLNIHIIEYAGHGVVEPNNMCAIQFTSDLLSVNGKADASCLRKSLAAPDWDGSTQEMQEKSMTYFGTADLWNNGMVFDSPTPTSSSYDCEWDLERATSVVLYAAVPMGLTIIVLSAVIVWLCMKQQHALLLDKRYAPLLDKNEH